MWITVAPQAAIASSRLSRTEEVLAMRVSRLRFWFVPRGSLVGLVGLLIIALVTALPATAQDATPAAGRG